MLCKLFYRAEQLGRAEQLLLGRTEQLSSFNILERGHELLLLPVGLLLHLFGTKQPAGFSLSLDLSKQPLLKVHAFNGTMSQKLYKLLFYN